MNPSFPNDTAILAPNADASTDYLQGPEMSSFEFDPPMMSTKVDVTKVSDGDAEMCNETLLGTGQEETLLAEMRPAEEDNLQKEDLLEPAFAKEFDDALNLDSAKGHCLVNMEELFSKIEEHLLNRKSVQEEEEVIEQPRGTKVADKNDQQVRRKTNSLEELIRLCKIQLVDLNEKFAKSEEKNTLLVKNNQSLKQRNALLEDQCGKFQNLTLKKDEEVKGLKSKLEKLESSLANRSIREFEAIEEKLKREEELKAKNEEIAKLEEQLNGTVKAMEELREEMMGLRKANAELIAQNRKHTEEEFASLKKKIKELEEDLKKASEKLEEAVREKDTLLEKNSKLEDQLKDLQQPNASLPLDDVVGNADVTLPHALDIDTSTSDDSQKQGVVLVDGDEEENDANVEDEEVQIRDGEKINEENEEMEEMEGNEVPVIGKMKRKRRAKTFRLNNKKHWACLWNECGKKFQKESEFKKHYRIHIGDRPFKCDFVSEGIQCGMAFTQKSVLKRHLVIHTGEKPFICDFVSEGIPCGKKYRRKQQLVDHRKKHTGENLYKCSLCGKTFVYGQKFSWHRAECMERNGK